MNLKQILTLAVIATIFAGSSCVTFAADNSDDKAAYDRSQRRLSRRVDPNSEVYERIRFVKLTMDDRYTYYLDRESVKWVRVPFTSSEYMADVWIRMVDRFPEEDYSDVNKLYSRDIDEEVGEIAIAREKNIRYAPSDLEVLNQQEYFLEHYYLRPKTKQIQFLCEIEVVGRPQNNVEGREYSYANWEDLIPGSVESMLYKAVLKEIGTSMADPNGHQTFADYFEEITRISIR